MGNSNSFQTGRHIKWSCGNGTGSGQIEDRFEREVSRTLQGTQVTRNGDEDNPAYLIKQEDGDRVLKRGSELEEQD